MHEGASTISSPLVLTLSLEDARQLFGSLGNTIALIEANSDPWSLTWQARSRTTLWC